jgi:hypothetical protein
VPTRHGPFSCRTQPARSWSMSTRYPPGPRRRNVTVIGSVLPADRRNISLPREMHSTPLNSTMSIHLP